MTARLAPGDTAPDFALLNHAGRPVRLAELCAHSHVLLVFNLGFVWAHCTDHMAQLRHEYEQFRAADAEVVVIVPNGPKTIERYLATHPLPYPVLSDKGNLVAQRYGINTHQARFLALFTRTVFLIDRDRRIRCASYDASYLTEPGNAALLAGLDCAAGPTPLSAAWSLGGIVW